MTKVDRFHISDMAMSITGFSVKDKYHEEKMKLYGGYKPECIKCEHSCKQWNCPGLTIECHIKGVFIE